MGQYWKPVVCANNAMVAFSTRGAAKLTEHSWLANDTCLKVCEMIYDEPKRIFWVGDYCDEPINEVVDEKIKKRLQRVYRTAFGDKEALKPVLDDKDFETNDGYLINHSKKEYVDFNDYIGKSKDSEGWCLHPLPLLTVIPGGNGLGGGDYWSDIGKDFLGYWCGDKIEYTKKIPSGFNQIEVAFIDGRI